MPQRTDDLPLGGGQIAAVQEALGHRVKELREAQRLSQRRAAAVAGVDQKVWNRLELGQANPTLSSLLAIQHALGAESLESLLGRLPSRELLDHSA